MISRKKRAALFRNVFRPPMGRELLKDLFKSYGKRPSFDKDTHKMAYNEGQRSVYLTIARLADIDLHTLEQEVEQSDAE